MLRGTLPDMLSIQKLSFGCVFVAAAIAAGCGSSSSSSSATTSSGGSSGTSSRAAGGSAASGAGALAADARSAATGDIPDNQVFLVFTNPSAGYSMKYPEGWTQTGSGDSVTFHDKNNLVRIMTARGAAPTPATVAARLDALKQSDRALTFRAPQAVTIGSVAAIKAVYKTESAPNPVTGKRVQLIVDRYVLAHGGRVATVDLGTPKGVDNVDAYRMMIESFRWR